MRWDGGGSHRLAGPGREQLFSQSSAAKASRYPSTLQLLPEGCRWTRHVVRLVQTR